MYSQPTQRRPLQAVERGAGSSTPYKQPMYLDIPVVMPLQVATQLNMAVLAPPTGSQRSQTHRWQRPVASGVDWTRPVAEPPVVHYESRRPDGYNQIEMTLSVATLSHSARLFWRLASTCPVWRVLTHSGTRPRPGKGRSRYLNHGNMRVCARRAGGAPPPGVNLPTSIHYHGTTFSRESLRQVAQQM